MKENYKAWDSDNKITPDIKRKCEGLTFTSQKHRAVMHSIKKGRADGECCIRWGNDRLPTLSVGNCEGQTFQKSWG